MNFALLGFRIHKLTLQEVQFAVKLRCYNPTKSPITLAVNQVTANYKGSAKKGRVRARIAEHLGEIPGAKVRIKPFSSISEAREKEAKAIKKSQPKYNKKGK